MERSSKAYPEGATRRLGAYIANNHDVILPPDLTEWMKLLVVDTLGCGLFGSHLPWTEQLFQTVAATEGLGRCLIWGRVSRHSPTSAALVNGNAVHGFEIDDVGAKGHFGATTVTSALALAEAGAPLSGSELLKAMVTGIEVGARITACLTDVAQVTCGFHGPGLFGTFAAAATGAYVLNLDTEQCVNALGHAAQFASGLMATHHGGMGKRLLMGRAAQSGTFAALLAAHDFTNVDDILDPGYGSFTTAFSGGRELADPSQLTNGLGQEYRSYDVSYKLWACREPIHPSLEAIKSLRQERALDPDTVERVMVALPEGSFKAVGMPYQPSTEAAAQLNLQYCLASMLLYNEVFIDSFGPDQIRSPEVLDMVSRIEVRYSPELDQGPDGKMARRSLVEIALRDGRRIEQLGILRGRKKNPVTPGEVLAKFRRVTEGVVPSNIQEGLANSCMRLDELGAVGEVIDWLVLAGKANE